MNKRGVVPAAESRHFDSKRPHRHTAKRAQNRCAVHLNVPIARRQGHRHDHQQRSENDEKIRMRFRSPRHLCRGVHRMCDLTICSAKHEQREAPQHDIGHVQHIANFTVKRLSAPPSRTNRNRSARKTESDHVIRRHSAKEEEDGQPYEKGGRRSHQEARSTPLRNCHYVANQHAQRQHAQDSSDRNHAAGSCQRRTDMRCR